MNVSTSKTILFACTFLCGAVAKIYDDLVDNYRLHKFSNPTLLEVLKGTFMLTLTFTSIFNPLWGLTMWVSNWMLMFCEPLSYELPYERSLYITYGILFIFINYDKLFEQIIELYYLKYEVTDSFLTILITFVGETVIRKIMLLPFVPQSIRGGCNNLKEVSVYKIISTSAALIWFMLINQSNITTKLFTIWQFGYAIIRLFTQIYSLFVYKPKSFPLDETVDKLPDVKEEQQENPKDEEPKEAEEPKEPKEEEPKEEEPAKTPETI
jgi:hypothetical protein